MSRDDALLADILECAGKAQRDAGRHTLASFVADDTQQNAMIRYLEVIGEAAAHLTQELRDAHPEIAWNQMIGMRNRLIHANNEVDLDVVWIAVTVELPPLVERLLAIA